MLNIDTSTTEGEALNSPNKDQEAQAYFDGLDLTDPYHRIVSCSLSQSRNTGPYGISDSETAPEPPKTRSRSLRSAYKKTYNGIYYLRAGTGTKGTKHCGQIITIGACEDKNCNASLPMIIRATCHKYDCPECYHSAVERAAKEAADRSDKFGTDFLNETGESPGKKKHIIVSPPQTYWTRERILSDNGKALDRQFKKVMDYAFKDGFYAFETMLHLEREKHKDGTDCPGKDCTLPASEHIWPWGPHYHSVGYGFVKPIQDIQRKFPGWNIKVIPEKKGEPRDAYATLLYQGSHASIFYNATTHRQSRKLIMHVGLSNPRTYRRKLDHVEYDQKKCLCGRSIKVFYPTETYQPDRSLDLGPLYEKKEHFSYQFNHNALTKFFRKREERRAYENSDQYIKERARTILQDFEALAGSKDHGE